LLVASCSDSNTVRDDDTASICVERERLAALAPVVETSARWSELADLHPEADPRLIDAIRQIDAAVVDERTLDSTKWNDANDVIREVCGEA
jgi:hypothetical protein